MAVRQEYNIDGQGPLNTFRLSFKLYGMIMQKPTDA